jgi:hypothetical protein
MQWNDKNAVIQKHIEDVQCMWRCDVPIRTSTTE